MSRTVIITGVCGGIGAATAAHLIAQNWLVVGIDRVMSPIPGLDMHLTCDMADEVQVMAAFERVSRRHGKLDALVNNAAIQLNKTLAETTVEEWDDVMAANVRSVFLGIKHGQSSLSRGCGGAIVNVASVHAIATSGRIAAYAASKGAVMALTRAAAIDLSPLRIRVNALLPGAIDTNMLRDGITRSSGGSHSVEDGLAALAQRTVLGRIGTGNEIANAVSFLIDSERSSFMTGQALVVDGGATTKLSTE